MKKMMNLTALMAAIQAQIQDGTGLMCYDAVPDNAASPFYRIELAGNKPANTKTMYVQQYDFDIHVIAPVSRSSVPVHTYIQKLEEALTDDIMIPAPYFLVRQDETGVRPIQDDETGEKHAVVGFSFLICYGFMVKV